MRQQNYEPLSTPLTSYVRLSTFLALESYCEERQRSRDVIVDTALSAYLNGQASGEVEHLRQVCALQEERIQILLSMHDQP